MTDDLYYRKLESTTTIDLVDMIRDKDKRIAELEKSCDETQELLDKQIEATYKLVEENAEAKNLIEELASSLSVVGECDEEECELINKAKKELEEEKKLNAEIKARFVKCNTCTDEMKSKCLMFTENLCEGERCEELIDIVSLVNKSELERKIEALEKANEWHYPSKGELPKCDEKTQLIFYVNCYYGDITRKRMVLGYYQKSFMNDDVKLFVEKSKGYEDEHLPKDVIAWKEIVLPEISKENE